MKKVLVMVLAMVALSVSAQEGGAPKKEGGGGRPNRPDRPNRPGAEMMANRMKENAAKILQKFDKDGDGQLSEAEKAEADKQMAEAEEAFRLAQAYKIIKAVDTNGDFILSDEELAALPQKMQELRQQAPGMQGGAERQRRRQNANKENADKE